MKTVATCIMLPADLLKKLQEVKRKSHISQSKMVAHALNRFFQEPVMDTKEPAETEARAGKEKRMIVRTVVQTVLDDLKDYLQDGQTVEFDLALLGDGPDGRVKFSVVFDRTRLPGHEANEDNQTK